jgi:hypothetical protein
MPEPHPEAQTLEPVVVREMRESRNWHISHGRPVDQDESDFLDAWDVLAGRLEQAEKERQEWEDRAGDALATLNTVELERDDLSEAARINRSTGKSRRSGEGPH